MLGAQWLLNTRDIFSAKNIQLSNIDFNKFAGKELKMYGLFTFLSLSSDPIILGNAYLTRSVFTLPRNVWIWAA